MRTTVRALFIHVPLANSLQQLMFRILHRLHVTQQAHRLALTARVKEIFLGERNKPRPLAQTAALQQHVARREQPRGIIWIGSFVPMMKVVRVHHLRTTMSRKPTRPLLPWVKGSDSGRATRRRKKRGGREGTVNVLEGCPAKKRGPRTHPMPFEERRHGASRWK